MHQAQIRKYLPMDSEYWYKTSQLNKVKDNAYDNNLKDSFKNFI